MQSYNQILNALNQFSTAHLAIQRFKMSTYDQINMFATVDAAFPILYAVPIDSVMGQYTNTITLRIYALDLLQEDRSNEADVFNDTLLILNDLRNWIYTSNVDLNLTNNPIAIPVNSALLDKANGWFMDMVMEFDSFQTECSIPFVDNFQITGSTCDITYVQDFLTCATLDECSTFINLQNQVNGNSSNITNIYSILSGVTGGTGVDIYTTGATFDVATQIATFERNDGNDYILNLSALSTTDVFVTGGTYNQSNGVSTFTNNTGGTFTVSGYLTGSTGFDIYTTGATYSNGFATFNRNDGNDYILDLTALTGGTGGIPTLQQVTDVGFITTNPIFVSGNSLFNSNSRDAFALQILDADNSDNLTVGAGTNLNGQGFITLYDESGNTQTTIENGDISITGQYFGDGSQLTGIANTFTTGATFNPATRTATFNRNDGNTYLLTGITDTTVTGGTYNNPTGTATFTNNTGGTFTVTGFTTGQTVALTVSSTTINSGATNNVLYQSGTTLMQSNAFNYITSSNTLILSAATANLSLRTPNNSLHMFDSGSPSSGYYIGTAPTVTGNNNYMLFSPASIQFFNLPTGARTFFTFTFSSGNLEIGNYANRFRVAHSSWATNWELGGRDGNFGLTNTGIQPAGTTRGVFWQEIGVAPVASTIPDAFQQYAADATTGGTAAPHFRTENGNVIKLYQQNTGTTQATIVHATGTNIKVDDTFDGYTLAQIVRALRNAGFLA